MLKTLRPFLSRMLGRAPAAQHVDLAPLAEPLGERPLLGLQGPAAAATFFRNPLTVRLLEVVLQGDEAQARRLIAEGGDVNDSDTVRFAYMRPLHYVILVDDKRALSLLLRFGADPRLSVKSKGNAFAFAITQGAPHLLEVMLREFPVSTLPAEAAARLLFHAALHPQGEPALPLLLKAGIPVDAPDSLNRTILGNALESEDLQLAEWLLKQGAQLHRGPDSNGDTPATILERLLAKTAPSSSDFTRLQQLRAVAGADSAATA